MEFKLETITPAKAVEYLKHNTNNYRKLSRAKYKQYAEDMRNGKWQPNGEPIIFGEDGILKDGQHRLAAIIDSKKTVQIAVVRGVDKNVDIFDVGMTRTALQITRNHDVDANPTIIATAGIILGGFKKSVAKSQIAEYVAEHIDELNRAFRCTTYGSKPFSKKASCVTASYILLRNKKLPCYDIELFFRLFSNYGYVSAEGYDPSPAIVARQQFEERSYSSGAAVRKEQLEIGTRALLDFHEGKHVGTAYKVQEPFIFEEFLNAVRKADKI